MVGGALETVTELKAALCDWHADPAYLPRAKAMFATWDALLDSHQAPTNTPVPTCAQVTHQVNLAASEHDTLISAAGDLAGEIGKGWRIKSPHTFDLEFDFSCMGYEIAAGWGCAMAQNDPGAVGGASIVTLGDGTYMMMNSDIYSSVLSGHKMIIVVCDKGGYAVISRLQQVKGVPGFNNLLQDCRVLNSTAPLRVDFAAHAAAMGAASRHVESLSDLAAALE
ncbi:MAG: thiamine pyrophosphate-dependent enzyme [Cypionkella sp.]